MFCDQHKDGLSTMYNYVINACVTASAHIPKHLGIPIMWFYDGMIMLDSWENNALSWHYFWNIHGQPRDCNKADMHRDTQAWYHREGGHLTNNAVKINWKKCLTQLFLIKVVVGNYKVKGSYIILYMVIMIIMTFYCVYR